MPFNSPEKKLAYDTKYAVEHRAEIRAAARKRYSESLERRRKVAAHAKRWAADNRESRRASVRKWQANNARKAWGLHLAVYGITPEQYDEMLAAQGGHCAICPRTQQSNVGKRRLAVDHCHKTGRVRGLLCHRCNLAVGYLGDDAGVTRSAARYLEKR